MLLLLHSRGNRVQSVVRSWLYIIYLVYIFIRIYMGNRERILEREPTAVAPPSSTSLMNNGQVTYETNEHEKGEKKYKGGKKKSFSVPLFSTSLASNDLFLLFWFFKISFYLFSRLFIAVKSIERLFDVIQFEHEHLFLLSFLMLSPPTHNSNCIHKRRVKPKKK